MLRYATLAAAAAMLAGPVAADETCLPDAGGAQCDVVLDEYRSHEVPIGTTNVWPSDEFLLERYQDFRPEAAVEFPAGEDVLYWNGERAMIVPEESGPRLEIANW